MHKSNVVFTSFLADPIKYNPGWTGRRLLNSTIEPEKSVFDKIKEFYDPNTI
jgi:hypothetical protein